MQRIAEAVLRVANRT